MSTSTDRPSTSPSIELAAQLFAHPLTQQFGVKWRRGDNTIHTVTDVLGERLLRVASLLYMNEKRPDTLRMNVNDDDREAATAAFALLALQAPPYLWTEAVRMTIAQHLGPDPEHPALPRHTISSKLLPTPRMWWTFETGVEVGGPGREVTVDLMVIEDDGEGFCVYTMGMLSDASTRAIEEELERLNSGWRNADGASGVGFLERVKFQYGSVYPDDFINHQSRKTLESVLAFLGFLNSPYIPKVRQTLKRQQRRDLQRRGLDEFSDHVTFIELRRPEPRGSVGGDEQQVDWKHQWVVSGHYRAQWYPSENAHHVIWIAPYLKGPADAPMLEHAYRVRR